MKSIQNILQTDGIEFLDSLMNDYLVVYEKLNASTLSFRRIENELKFYKGRDNEEITSLNETLYTYFKEGIEYLRRVSLIFYMEFPEGWLFRMQYFNPNAPGLVNYELQPKNNLVLSCIDTGNSIIEDTSVLKRWADRLQIDVAEPVFSGFLSEFQKEKLIDYVNGNADCENISFSQYIISLLNPRISHSAYSDTFNTSIDSFIFKFYKAGSKKCVHLKLVDPYMEELLKQNKDKFGTNSGTENEIILANFVAWLQTIDLKEIDIEGDSDDDRYMDLLCKLFNKYAEKEQKLLKDLKSNLNESYTVDVDKIKNSETAKILKDYPNMTKAFQVIVGSFMNKKNDDNDPMSIMDDGLKELFNDEVSSIKRLTSTKDDQVKSFTELIKSSMKTDSDKESDSDKVMSFTELMDKIGYAEPEKEDEQEETEQKAKEAEPQKTKEEVKEEHKEEKESEDSETEKSEKEDTSNSEKSENSHESDSSNTADEKSEESSNTADEKSEESSDTADEKSEESSDNADEKSEESSDTADEKSEESSDTADEKSEDEDSKEDEDKKEEETKDDNTEDEKTDKDESDDKKESEEKTDDSDDKPKAEQEEKEHSAPVSTSSDEGSDKPKEKEKKEKPAKEDSGDGSGFA